ncbi:sigma factor [Sinorhizobium sp. NFACC03]|uniref:RNA polymerase sigma factor n=1 Tax=Sinorhizobium sp. NFACC03 TaxID=1566295 RepID=UPI00088460BC|nr:sigma factor [Sinorhizobium sp. NFACC03]SDA86125.1 RNA polymerase sporulation-specific sigma factor [Sinorhizobium sp. NFACC03]
MTKAIPKDVRDLDEVRERIEGLTGVEALKLEQIARRFVAPCDAGDLVQEAFSRIIEGTRNWPADLEFLPFMVQVMRSIASTDRRKADRRPELRVVPQHGEQLTFDTVADPKSTPEEIVGEWDELAAAKELFADDDIATTYIDAIVAGFRRSEIMELCDLDANGYDTVTRRIKRRLEKRSLKDVHNA